MGLRGWLHNKLDKIKNKTLLLSYHSPNPCHSVYGNVQPLFSASGGGSVLVWLGNQQ